MNDHPSHHIEYVMCPYCTALHDGAMNAGSEDTPPVDGDVNVCGKCSHVSIYDSSVKGGLRLPTPEETEKLGEDKEIMRAVRAVKQANWVFQRRMAHVN